MCKVLIIPGIKKEHRTRTLEFIKEMAKEMTPSNTDGLGYAAVTEDGKLFGQRWLVNADAFGGPTQTKLKPFQKALSSSVEHTKGEANSFNLSDESFPGLKNAVAITLHTRMATSPKSMQNVHPFVYSQSDTSLIHNGVISNDDKFPKSVSTCDSEAILYNYINHKVNHNPEQIAALAKDLNGYYACGVFSRDGNGARILDVFKGNSASLYMQEIKELDIYVFATSSDDVSKVCNRLRLTKGDSIALLEGKLIRINPVNGELYSITEFNVPPRTFTNYSTHSDRGSHSWSKKWNDTSTNTGDTNSRNETPPKQLPFTKKQGLSESMIFLLKLSPTIKELSRQEVKEFGRANKWWETWDKEA